MWCPKWRPSPPRRWLNWRPGCQCRALREGGPAHHESRGHTSAGGRDPAPENITLRLRRNLPGVRRSSHRHGLSLYREAVMSSSGSGQSLLRADSDLQASAVCPGGRRAGGGKVIVEGFCRFRLRDYPAHRLRDGRHSLLRPHRPPPGSRRLPRILAAPGDVGAGPGQCAGNGWQKVARPRAGTACSESSSSSGDEVIFSEVSPRPPRHGPGHADLAGAVRIRPARASLPRAAGSADTGAGARRLCRDTGQGESIL